MTNLYTVMVMTNKETDQYFNVTLDADNFEIEQDGKLSFYIKTVVVALFLERTWIYVVKDLAVQKID